MENSIKKLSPVVFVLALICFFLPFVTFSCQGQKIATFSGIQLVTGTTIQQPQMFGPPTKQKVDAEPLAILAFVCAIAGLGLSFLKSKKSAVAPAIAAGVGLILTLALKSKLDGHALKQGQGIIQIEYAVGFYIMLIAFIAAATLNVFALMRTGGIHIPAFKDGVAGRFCSQCGARNSTADLFCRKCGAKIA